MDKMKNSEALKRQLAQLEADYVSGAKKILGKALLSAKKGDKDAYDVLRSAKPETVTSSIYSVAKRNKLVLDGMASFRRSISIRHYARQLQHWEREWVLNDKMVGLYFANQMGIDTPRIHARATLPECVAVCREGNMVLKPENGAGSRYVYLVHSDDAVYSVKDSRWTDLSAVNGYLANEIKLGKVKDSWIVEDLLLETSRDGSRTPSRDLKFYCFYGKCGLILEIRREPRIEYCFWMPDGRQVVTGKYESEHFAGDGATPAQIQLVEDLSREIPAPFMRIDFLKSDQSVTGMLLGEFTPSPGTYEDFNEEFDRYLGTQFCMAEERLFRDLIAGKTFAFFRDKAPTRQQAVEHLLARR